MRTVALTLNGFNLPRFNRKTKWMIAQDAVLVVFRSVDAMSNLLGMNH